MTPATFATSNALDRMTIEEEVLPGGAHVFVATDMDLDGCIAQGSTPDEAAAALIDARRDYGEVLRMQRLSPRQGYVVASQQPMPEGVYIFGSPYSAVA